MDSAAYAFGLVLIAFNSLCAGANIVIGNYYVAAGNVFAAAILLVTLIVLRLHHG